MVEGSTAPLTEAGSIIDNEKEFYSTTQCFMALQPIFRQFTSQTKTYWIRKKANILALARNFKRRWPKHKATLLDRHADGQTTLTSYVHKKRDENSWRVTSQTLIESLEYASCVPEKNSR